MPHGDLRFWLFEVATRGAVLVVFLVIAVSAFSRTRAGERAYAPVLWWAICGLALGEGTLAAHRSFPVGAKWFWAVHAPLQVLVGAWIVYGVWRVVVPLMKRSQRRESESD